MTFRLHVINARFGDCLLLEYGAQKSRYILFDGGPAQVWKEHLEPTLAELEFPALAAVVLTHVDTDHTTGLRDMFAALEKELKETKAMRFSIGSLWMNVAGEILGKDGRMHKDLRVVAKMASEMGATLADSEIALAGAKDGNDLRIRARSLDIPLNDRWASDAILVGKSKPFKLGNLKFTVVGPSQANLDALKDEWAAWIKRQRKLLNAGKPAFAATVDKSTPNLSSSQFLVESGGRSLLLTGDGRGDHLLAGLEATGRLDDEGGIDVDVLKLPHHGSDRNVDRRFFERVRATTYIASADGRDGNPDRDTLRWIVEAAHEAGRDIEIVVTNRTDSVKELVKKFPPAKWGYTLRERKAKDHAIVVDLEA